MMTEEIIGTVLNQLTTDLDMVLNYYHGSPLAISNNLAKIKDGASKYPCIVLFDEFEEKGETDPTSLFNRTATVNLFFMDVCRKEWTIEEHIENCISPMALIVDQFLSLLDISKYFGRVESYIRVNRSAWGLYIQSENNKKSVFPDLLSGVELRVTLPIKKQFC